MQVDKKLTLLSQLAQESIKEKKLEAALLYCEAAISFADNYIDGLDAENLISAYKNIVNIYEELGDLKKRSLIMKKYIHFVSTIKNGLAWSIQLSVTESSFLKENGFIYEANEILIDAANLLILNELEASTIPLSKDIFIGYGQLLFDENRYDEAEYFLKKAVILEKLS